LLSNNKREELPLELETRVFRKEIYSLVQLILNSVIFLRHA
jgi:hypothetical protein